VLSVRRLAGDLVVLAGGSIAAATVLGLLGSAWWPFDLAANFRVQYLVVLPVLAAGAVLFGRRAAAAVMMGAAVINLSLVAPYLWGRPHTAPAAGDPVEVVSFNVGISNSERGRVMQWLAAEDPDLVFLFESSFEWEDAARFAGLPYRMVAVVPPGRLSGVTILVRDELSPVLLEIPFDVREAAAVRIEADGSPLTVLGVHPLSPTTGARSAGRNEVLRQAGEWIATVEEPLLLVGDLNATPWSSAHRALRREGRLFDSLAGRGLQPTWPDGWGPLMIPIDHALHSGGVVVLERRTGPATGSAHRPLIVTVAAAEAS